MIKRKLERYLQVLNNIDDPQDKFVWIMDFGKNSRPMSDSLQVREFEVPGCQSQTWLVPHFIEDKIYLFDTAVPSQDREYNKIDEMHLELYVNTTSSSTSFLLLPPLLRLRLR